MCPPSLELLERPLERVVQGSRKTKEKNAIKLKFQRLPREQKENRSRQIHATRSKQRNCSKFRQYQMIMENSRRRGLSDAEATKMLDKILEEDEQALDEETSMSCPPYAGKDNPTRRVCDCMRIAENSSRFSLRVMEAMRSLQHEEDAFLPSCTVEDIVGYIVENYRDDGDLYAQVRTALKQVCSQGFVMEVLEDEYHLVGPDAISMNKVTCSNKRGDCLLSSTPKPAPKRRKKDDDDCICEESTDDETALKKTRRRSPTGRARRRRTRILDVETRRDVGEEEDEAATLDTDDEDVRLDNRKESSSTAENGEDIGRTYFLGKEKRAGLAPPINFFRRRSARIQERSARAENGDATAHVTSARSETSEKRDEDDSIIEGTLSDDLNDAGQEPHSLLRTKKDDKRDQELKRWIKRCQAECVRQGRRRRNN